jgi:hypothetical protein
MRSAIAFRLCQLHVGGCIATGALEGQMSESTAPSSPALLGHKRSFCDSPKADSTLQEENRQQMLRRRTDDLNDSNEGAESPDAMTTV